MITAPPPTTTRRCGSNSGTTLRPPHPTAGTTCWSRPATSNPPSAHHRDPLRTHTSDHAAGHPPRPRPRGTRARPPNWTREPSNPASSAGSSSCGRPSPPSKRHVHHNRGHQGHPHSGQDHDHRHRLPWDHRRITASVPQTPRHAALRGPVHLRGRRQRLLSGPPHQHGNADQDDAHRCRQRTHPPPRRPHLPLFTNSTQASFSRTRTAAAQTECCEVRGDGRGRPRLAADHRRSGLARREDYSGASVRVPASPFGERVHGNLPCNSPRSA